MRGRAAAARRGPPRSATRRACAPRPRLRPRADGHGPDRSSPHLHPVADLGVHHDTDGGVDRIALVEPAGAERSARQADPLRLDGRDDAAAIRPRAARRPARAAGPPRDRRPRAGRRPGPRTMRGTARAPCRRRARRRAPIAAVVEPVPLAPLERLRATNHTASSRRRPPWSPRSTSTASTMSSALPTASPSGWDMSVTAARGRPLRPAREREARRRERPGILGRLHERPGPGLHVEQDQSVPDRELLRHHARRDQRDRRHRRGRVAQGVQGPVGGHESRRLRGDGAPDRLAPARRISSGVRSVRRPGIDSSLSRVPPVWPRPRPESFATASPSAAASGREDEGHAVGDPAGGVLVHRGPVEIAERDRVARGDHRARHRQRLVLVQAPQQRRHEERGGERIAELALRVTSDEGLDLPGASVPPSRFAAITARGSIASSRAAPGPPDRARADRSGRRSSRRSRRAS